MDETVSKLMGDMRLNRSVPVAYLPDGTFVFGQVRVIQHEGVVCELRDPAVLPGGHKHVELAWDELAEFYRLLDSAGGHSGDRKRRLELHLRSPKAKAPLRAVDRTCPNCGGPVDFKGAARVPRDEKSHGPPVQIEIREDPSVAPGHVVWLVPPR